MTKSTVLVADPIGDVLGALTERAGEKFTLVPAADGEKALNLIRSLRPAVAVVDLVLPSLDGLGLLERAAELTKIIVVSAFFNDALASRCAALGAWYFMPKPCDAESLLNRVTQAAGAVSAKQIADPSAGLLLDMGISPNLKGYHYLLEAIALAQGGAGAVTKEIYPAVAKRFSTKPALVERSIRHAVEAAWKAGRIALPKRPTNSQFIALVAEKLRMGDWR